MSYKLAGFELESPLLNAAGLINGTEEGGILRDVATLADTPIGAITVGSLTIPRRLGNAAQFGEPTFYYDTETGTMTNSLGLPNIGLDAAENLVDDIHGAAGDKPVIFSVSPVTSEHNIGSSVEQSVEMVNRLYAAGAQIVELNVSCPNIVTESGSRKPIMGHDTKTMEELMMAFEGLDSPVIYRRAGLGLKLPPYLSVDELRTQKQVAKMIMAGPVGFLTTSNTIPGSKPLNINGDPILSVPGGTGGKSGPATKLEGRLQLSTWEGLTKGIPIISALGVYDGEEMAIREELGATASEMNTRLWNSRNWKSTIAAVLGEYTQYQA